MINNAKLQFDENGLPFSEQFDDIYFSKKDGFAETEYVFLKHNGLPERFKSSSGEFHIAETGFGTGLNLLVTWLHLNQENNRRANTSLGQPLSLRFTTFEKYPLNKTDLEQALFLWPQFKPMADELLAAYPENVSPDNHISLNNGLITLRMIVGDVNETIQDLHFSESDKVDAWYLDGFAPSKNPEMWTDNLFTNMKRLTKPTGTLATFTAAGMVRRALISAGFDVKKHKGFGYKRDMLATPLTLYTDN